MLRGFALGFVLFTSPVLAAGDAPGGGMAEPDLRPVVIEAEIMCPVDLTAPDLLCAPGSRAAYWRGIGIDEHELAARVFNGTAPEPAPVPLPPAGALMIAALWGLRRIAA